MTSQDEFMWYWDKSHVMIKFATKCTPSLLDNFDA
jgi:hypothetical protein